MTPVGERKRGVNQKLSQRAKTPRGVGSAFSKMTKEEPKLRYVEGFMPTPGDFYINRILIKIDFKPALNPSKPVQNHVKLIFLSAALDPQEMVQRYWSYQGFMPIFWFGLMVWMCKFFWF